MGSNQAYTKTDQGERKHIEDAIRHKNGILNRYLELVPLLAEYLRHTGEKGWLDSRLMAGRQQGGRLDIRDFYLALAELYVAADETGIDAERKFATTGGAIPPDFGKYKETRKN